jgi:hypothetical protein
MLTDKQAEAYRSIMNRAPDLVLVTEYAVIKRTLAAKRSKCTKEQIENTQYCMDIIRSIADSRSVKLE